MLLLSLRRFPGPDICPEDESAVPVSDSEFEVLLGWAFAVTRLRFRFIGMRARESGVGADRTSVLSRRRKMV